MRIFNPNGYYEIHVNNKVVEVRQFKNENSLILYGNKIANKKRSTLYIIERQARKHNFWQFAR